MLGTPGRASRRAIRSLLRTPGFTGVVLVTLGLGVGASTAIFSVVDGILLRPLPFSEPERLVAVWADYTRRGGPEREWLSFPNAYDLREEPGVLESLGLYGGWAPTLMEAGEATLLFGGEISVGMFSRVLRVPPARGRGFLAGDGEPGAERVVMLSHGTWQDRFGGDPAIVGRVLTLDEEPHTIVGVMPKGFRPPFLPDAQIWRPEQANATTYAGSRASAIYRAIGRLQDGVDLETARARATALAGKLEAEYPDANTGVGFTIRPLKSDITAAARPALWVLLGAVGLVLLIVCVNVANLLLARGSARQTDLAVRAALGAGRGRLFRGLLIESALLALLGGGLGVLLAAFGTDLLVALAPPDTPRLHEVSLDVRVLGFAVGVTVLSGLLFGLLPAIRVPRLDLQSAIRSSSGSTGQGRGAGRTRSALVVGQVGLALTLLIGAGLLLRSFRELSRFDPGFDPRQLLTVRIDLPATGYPERVDMSAFVSRLESRLRALPGVTDVGTTNTLPLLGLNSDVDFMIEGRPRPRPGEELVAWIRRVTPDYFQAMGIEIISGRPFTISDDDVAPRVVIVNQTVADRLFPEQSPIGQRVNLNSRDNPVWREIVGVAEDIKNFGIRRPSDYAIYFPYPQVASRRLYVILRTAGTPPASLVPSVRGVVAELDPALPLSNARPMGEIVGGSLAQDRFVAALLTGFAVIALVLAAVGLYGVVTYSVTRRMREMGVRIAIGAAAPDIRRLVIGRSLGLVAIGMAGGGLAAVLLTRFMGTLLFGVAALDPLTYLSVVALLAGVAIVASAVPAQRAARVDPVKVLKTE